MKSFIHKYWSKILLLFLIVVGLALGITAIIMHLNQPSGANISESDAESSTPEHNETSIPSDAPPQKPAFIDLQPTVDTWLSTLPNQSQVGLMIYDLDYNQIAASYHPNEVFNSASIYKLLFAYDGYHQIDQGLDNATTVFTYANDNFHSGALTLGDCLDLILRESYNTCADPLRSDPSRFARAEALTTELGLQNTSSAGLYSSAADLTKILQRYYTHPDLSETSWLKIQDSMLNQPATTYNWRQGLPSGFNVAQVYDKVGWNWTGSYWDPYNDAAIVEFPEQDRHYIVVVMTRFLPSFAPLVELGQSIESTVLAN